MSNAIEYRGYVIEPATHRRRTAPVGWTLRVRITPVGRKTGVRRCRAGNIYATEARAIDRCLEFGRRIVDGTILPKGSRADGRSRGGR